MLLNHLPAAPNPPIPYPATLPGSWHRLHEYLNQLSPTSTSLEWLAVYYHCVYEAFAQPPDAQRATYLATCLVAAGPLELGDSWAAPELRRSCALAWLHSRRALPEAAALLAHTDRAAVAHMQVLLKDADATSNSRLLALLRYLSLRLADAGVQHLLPPLLLRYLHRPLPPLYTGHRTLGFPAGLAGELLQILELQQLPGLLVAVQQYVRQGLLGLLSLRRAVDFAEQRYSAFPYQLMGPAGERVFGANLTWRHGDLGPALLLYQAHRLLQDAELKKQANLIGLNTLLRVTPDTTLVTSAHFQTGAAGVAYLYDKLQKVSQLEPYRSGYLFWLDQTQHLLQQELAGALPGQHQHQALPDLIAAGLVLMSASTPRQLDWDRLLE